MLSLTLFAITIAIVQSNKTALTTVTTIKTTKDVTKLKTSTNKVTYNNVTTEDTFETLLVSIEDNGTPKTVNVNDIANELVSLLKTKDANIRIQELKEKLKKIESYVIDRDKFNDYLKEQTSQTDLNSTSFYKSLVQDVDNLNFLKKKDAKNLYLQLKVRMNRDDIIRILAERADEKTIAKNARRMMGVDAVYDSPKQNDLIDAVIDKVLGEFPTDTHTFKHYKNESIHWDPERELKDLEEKHLAKKSGRRLFKGERTTIRYFPFMVSIHVVGRFWCGGVLYWHDMVLTSASCLQLMHNNRFFRENPMVLKVRVGSNHSRIGGEMIEALEVYFHPGYNPRTLRNNIALIRLRRRLFFSYHRIPKIIEISRYPYGIGSADQVKLLGWGVTKMSQKMSYEPIFLQQKLLPVYPSTFCKEVYGSKFISETMFCAGTMTTGEGACDHDAGGPAMLAGKLVGIISFGPTVCGFPNAPTVFTLVGAYADWLEQVNSSMPHYYRGKKHTTTTPRPLAFNYLQTLLHRHTYTPPTTTAQRPIAEALRQGTEQLEDKSRIPPPVFKLTKKSKKPRKKVKKERPIIDFEIDT